MSKFDAMIKANAKKDKQIDDLMAALKEKNNHQQDPTNVCVLPVQHNKGVFDLLDVHSPSVNSSLYQESKEDPLEFTQTQHDQDTALLRAAHQ